MLSNRNSFYSETGLGCFTKNSEPLWVCFVSFTGESPGSCPCCPASSHIVTFTLVLSYSNASLSSDCSQHEILFSETFNHPVSINSAKAKHYSHTMLLIFWIFLLLCPQSTADGGSGRRTQSCQSQEQQSVNHTSLPMRDSPVCIDDAIVGNQLKGERWRFCLASLAILHNERSLCKS